MERVDDELHIDYDSIEAPQFVDFHALSMINDDEEDPALKFFEVKEYVDDKKEDFDLQVVDERRNSDEIDKDQEQDAVIPLAGDDEGKDAVADAEDRPIEICRGDAEQVGSLPVAPAADQEPVLPPHAPIAEEVENIENVDPVSVPVADELVPLVVVSPEHQEQEQQPLVAVGQALNEVEVEHPLPRAAPAPRAAHPAAINSEIPRKLISTATGVTVPKPFPFHSARHRLADHPAPADKKDVGPGFRARPAPLKVLHGGPTGLKDKPEVRATVALAPHFASDDRIRSRHMSAYQSPTATVGVKENLDPKSGDAAAAGSHRGAFRSGSVPSTPVCGTNSSGRGRSPSPAMIRNAERDNARKRLMDEKLRKQDETNRLLMEQKQAKELREQLVHKPQPIKGTRPFQVKHSDKTLTNPISPEFAPLPSQRRNLQQVQRDKMTALHLNSVFGEMAAETEVKSIFPRTLGSTPSFLIINLQDEVVRSEAAEKRGLWRGPDKLSILVKKIECLGGRATLLQNVQEVRNGSDIPLVFVSTNIAHNELALKKWLHMADQHGRCFDIFHENFVHDIIEFGEVGLLEHYLIKPSMFEAGAYTGQQILSGSFKWRNFALDKEDSDREDTPRQTSPPSTSVKLDVSSDRDAGTIDHFDFNDPSSSLSLSLNQHESDSMITFQGRYEDSHHRMPAGATVKRTATGPSILDSPPTVRARRVSATRDSPPSSPPPPNRKNRGGASRPPRLPNLNPEDQQQILNYIIEHNAFYRIRGTALYKEMAQANIVPGRTFETLCNHMKRVLLRREVFERFGRRMDPSVRAKFEENVF